MSFNINAVVINAITRALADYQNQLFRSPEQADKLKQKHASILKTASESLGFPQLRVKGVQFILDLFPTFERWGYWADYIDVTEYAISNKLPTEQQIYLYANLGHLHHLNQNFHDSLHCLEQSLQLSENHQSKDVLGLIHHRLMNTYIGLDQPKIAQEHGLQALALLDDTPSKTRASAYDSLGRIYTRLNNKAMAEKQFRDALSLWEILEDYTHMTRSYINLGNMLWADGKLDDAKECFERALATMGSLSNLQEELRIRNGLGIIQYATNDFGSAVNTFQAAVNKLEQELGNSVGWYSMRGMLFQNLGNALVAQRDIHQALVALYKAKTYWQQANNNLQMANTIGTIAEAYLVNKECETAVTTYDEALSLLANYPDHPWAIKLTNDFSKAKKTCTDQLDNPEA